MNVESMKQSEDLESTRDLRAVSERVSEIRDRVSESGFERVASVESDGVHMREFNAILGSHKVSMISQYFPGSNWVKTWTGPDHAWPWMWLKWALDNP